jgi:hypothetical protein
VFPPTIWNNYRQAHESNSQTIRSVLSNNSSRSSKKKTFSFNETTIGNDNSNSTDGNSNSTDDKHNSLNAKRAGSYDNISLVSDADVTETDTDMDNCSNGTSTTNNTRRGEQQDYDDSNSLITDHDMTEDDDDHSLLGEEMTVPKIAQHMAVALNAAEEVFSYASRKGRRRKQ